jgi:hypothetical protein
LRSRFFLLKEGRRDEKREVPLFSLPRFRDFRCFIMIIINAPRFSIFLMLAGFGERERGRERKEKEWREKERKREREILLSKRNLSRDLSLFSFFCICFFFLSFFSLSPLTHKKNEESK